MIVTQERIQKLKINVNFCTFLALIVEFGNETHTVQRFFNPRHFLMGWGHIASPLSGQRLFLSYNVHWQEHLCHTDTFLVILKVIQLIACTARGGTKYRPPPPPPGH